MKFLITAALLCVCSVSSAQMVPPGNDPFNNRQSQLYLIHATLKSDADNLKFQLDGEPGELDRLDGYISDLYTEGAVFLKQPYLGEFYTKVDSAAAWTKVARNTLGFPGLPYKENASASLGTALNHLDNARRLLDKPGEEDIDITQAEALLDSAEDLIYGTYKLYGDGILCISSAYMSLIEARTYLDEHAVLQNVTIYYLNP